LKRFPSQVLEFIDALTTYWERRIKGELHQIGRRTAQLHPTISPEVRRKIISCLRPRLELIVDVAAKSASSEAGIARLTEQQLMALDYAAAEPRNLLVGGAGTGKTVLALEQAVRKAGEGRRVLFVCFNRLLARKLRLDIKRRTVDGVSVQNYHQLAIGLAQKFGRQIQFDEDWTKFRLRLAEAILELVASVTDLERYDYLVVDEAQDLMSEEFMNLLDCLLIGGLERGSWLIAADIQQTIFRPHFDADMFQRLCGWARRTSLDINCRNTRQIAVYVRALSGIGSVSSRSVDGELPILRYYADTAEYLRLLKKVVNELIASLSNANFPVSEITVLAGDLDFLPDDIRKPGFFLRAIREIDPDCEDHETIRAGTIQSFKGLEARAVVIVGIERFDVDVFRDLFYVGASRAKSILRILLPKNCDHFARAMPEITRMLGTTSDIGITS
jgi:superfamily I DNA/RNA helicase